MSTHSLLTDQVPTLDPGIACLETPTLRTLAVQQVALSNLRANSDVAYWVDARSNTSTYSLFGGVSNPRALDGVRIARAFTAYQHHSLVTDLPRQVTCETALVVAPAVTSLYRDDDLPDHESTALLDSALTTLSDLASTLDLPVLVSTPHVDALADRVRDRSDVVCTCERTGLGYHYDAPGFETTVYWDEGSWQTTIPYWVRLYGTAAGESDVLAPQLGLEPLEV